MKVSKFFLSSIVLFTTIFVSSLQANAALDLLGTDSLGNRLIYDTDLDVTWYDYSHGGTWDSQVVWADGLSVTFGSNVYTDWRLPTTVDGLYSYGYDGTTTGGYNITSSELGHLFYTELMNDGWYDTSGNETGCSGTPPYCLTNTGDFQNLGVSVLYWSGTEYSVDPTRAWFFYTYNGSQSTNDKDSNAFSAIAVMSGKAIVPEPVSSTLFIVGGATLGFRRFRKWGTK